MTILNKDEIRHLASLARLEVTDDELEGLTKDFTAILAYVDRVQEVNVEVESQRHPVVNIMREDEECYESEAYTEILLNEVPRRDGNYVQVPKIL
jgi:aspartyl-tRNA(Asn)/glutamyl-tRNA(Gln) amidotransferase subunit C